jgi:hypothetical protein
MTLKNGNWITILSMSALLAVASIAMAANAHFVGNPTATVSGDTLTVEFKAAGLGNAPTADFSLSASANIFSRCYTKKGNKPQAANKQETVTLSSDETFPVSNGQTTGTITLTAPDSTLDCPPGQVAVTESVTFEDVVLSGEGLTQSFGDITP